MEATGFRGRRSALALALLAMMVPAITCRPPEESQRAEQQVVAPLPWTGTERTIAPGECHLYAGRLDAGERSAFHFQLDQLGIDVAVEVIADGETLGFDGPTASVGSETGTVVTRGGEVELSVCAPTGTRPANRYRLHTEQTPVRGEDHVRVQAQDRYREARAYEKAGDDVRAAESYRAAADLWQQVDDARGQLWTALKLGKASTDPGDAEQHFKSAAGFAARLGDPVLEGRAWLEVGRRQRQKGHFEAAAVSYERALDRVMEGGDEWGSRAALNDLAVARGEQGDSARSMAAYHELLALWREAGDRDNEVKVLLSLATSHLDLGEPERALGLLDHAAERAGSDPEPAIEAELRERRGRAYLAIGEWSRARREFEAALPLREDPSNRAVTLNDLGRALFRLGDLESAGDTFQGALREALAASDERRVADVRLNMAAVLKASDPVAAGKLCATALEFFSRPEVADLAGQAAAHFCAAQMHAAQRHADQLRRARIEIESCLRLLEELRSRTLHPEQRTSYLADRRKYIDFHVALLHDLAQPEVDEVEALDMLLASERGRARTLYERLQPGAESKASKEDRDELRRLRGELRSSAAGAEPVESTAFLLDRYRTLAAKVAATRAIEPSALGRQWIDELRRSLEAGTWLVAYHLGEEHSFAWVVGASGITVVRLEVHRSEIERQARWIHDLLEADDGVASATQIELALQSLAEWVLDPVVGDLEAERLFLLLDGALHYIPFAALPSRGGDRLVERSELVQLPSLAVLRLLRERPRRVPTEKRRIAIFADPVFAAAEPGEAALPRLEGTRSEAMRIAARVPPDQRLLRLGFEARREALLSSEIRGYEWLHLATHALVDSERPELSRIVLSQLDDRGRPIDGLVLAFELADLQLDADMVVLSACRTALGREARGEGFVGLTRGLFAAGASRVVVSLWKVGDDATEELMDRFYAGLLDHHMPPATALANAQREMSRHPEHFSPYDWAGFVLQGDGF